MRSLRCSWSPGGGSTRCRPEYGARAWLYATARRVLANQARASARRGRLRDKLSAQPVTVLAVEDPLADRVHDALAALGNRDREECCFWPSGRG